MERTLCTDTSTVIYDRRFPDSSLDTLDDEDGGGVNTQGVEDKDVEPRPGSACLELADGER